MAQRTNARSSPTRGPASAPSASGQDLLRAALLVLGVVLAYLPALGAGTIWDDDDYLLENAHLGTWTGLAAIWVPGNTPQYYPAVFTSFWIEHALWGFELFGYHAVNVLLHAGNALLVLRLARAIGLPSSWILAALFALHPVHVESVAWITERKNVLSGCFYLLAGLAWLRFDAVRCDAVASRREAGRAWLTAFALFLAALLSKTVTCSLPAALILVHAWRRDRLDARRLLPLVPFFVVGLVLALHTAHLERVHVGARGEEFDHDFLERLQIATRALVFYPWKLLVPWPLVFVYPRFEIDTASFTFWLPALLVVSCSVAAVALWLRGVRGPFLGSAYFAGTLLPALGFFDVYPMRYSFVADHFQYLASLGILTFVAAGLRRLGTSRRALATVAVVLAVLGGLTFRQARDYADERTLWESVVGRNPSAWIAHNNLAQLAADRGEDERALLHLDQGLALSASRTAREQMLFNRARVLGRLGRHAEALTTLLDLHARGVSVEPHVAAALERLGRDAEAEAWYERALATPNRRDALLRLAALRLASGRAAAALPLLEERVHAVPLDVDARMIWCEALAAAGRIPEARQRAQEALVLARTRGDERLAELVAARLQTLETRGR